MAHRRIEKKQGSRKKRTNLLAMFMGKPISREEAARIRQVLNEQCESDEQTKVKEGSSIRSRRSLIMDYSPRAKKSFSEYESRLPIKGFRPGTPAHRRKACERIVAALQDPNYSQAKLYWQLYRLAVVEYVRETHTLLHDLLQVELEEIDEQAAIHFMLQSSLTRSVSTESLFEFYDLFGLMDNEYLLQETQKLQDDGWDVLLDIIRNDHGKLDQLADNVKKEKSTLESLKDRIKDLEARVQIRQTTKEVKPGPENPPSSEQQVNQLEQQLAAIEREISNIKVHAKEHPSKTEALNERLSTSLSRIDAELVDIRKTLQMLRGTTSELQNSIESLEVKLSVINSRISELPEAKPALDPALVSFGVPRAPKGSTKITSEDKFTAHYTLTLGKEHRIYVDTLQAYIYHKLFLESPVVILENRELLDAWISTLGWEKQCLSLVASPHWLSENDWASGANALLESSTTPRFIIIELFDVALVQCYLLPFLHRFSDRTKHDGSIHRLILVSSEPNVLNDYPDILRYGAAISADDIEIHKTSLRTFKTYIEEVRFGFDSSGNTFVPLRSVEQWRSGYDASSEMEEIWRASPKPIPRETQYLAQRLNVSVKGRMGRSEALLVSLYHTAKLWCQAKHGAEAAESMFELALIEAGDNYAY